MQVICIKKIETNRQGTVISGWEIPAFHVKHILNAKFTIYFPKAYTTKKLILHKTL